MPTRQVAFRFELALLRRLDQYSKRLRAQAPGLNVNRADVVRLLLEKALAAEGIRPTNKRKRARES